MTPATSGLMAVGQADRQRAASAGPCRERKTSPLDESMSVPISRSEIELRLRPMCFATPRGRQSQRVFWMYSAVRQ